MLGKRSAVVKFVRDKDLPADDPNRNVFEGPEVAAAYSEVAKDLITHAAVTIGLVWSACKIVERLCR